MRRKEERAAGEMIGNVGSRTVSLTVDLSMRPTATAGIRLKMVHQRITIPILGMIGMTKAGRMSPRSHANAVTPGLAGTMGKMTVLIVTVTAPPARAATRTEPLVAHIGPKVASAEVGLFLEGYILAELLYVRKCERPVVLIIQDTEMVE